VATARVTRHRVNMDDVARHAQVSTATVSRALRGMPGVSDGTRARILAVAEELDYVISPEASRLSGGATGRVALVVPRLDLWFYATIAASIDAELARAQLDVLLYQVDGEQQRRRFFDELPARRKVDAVVLAALPLLEREVERLDLLGVHVVVAGGRVRDYPFVRVDDRAVAEDAVDHLVSLGHTRIAMLRTDDTEGAMWSSDAERVEGFRRAVARHRLRLPRNHVITVPFGPAAGREAAERLLALDPLPTGVFAYCDEIAFGALQHLNRAGVDVPGRLSMVGVDNHPFAETAGLSTYDQAIEDQGRLAGRAVIALLEGHQPDVSLHEVATRFIDRGSTAPPPAS
jgi:LacI family repressor for deo operon, udp, cdd, tsx, nupC, and nupG